MRNIFAVLKEELKGDIPEKIVDQIPRGYQKIGDIMVISLKPAMLDYSKVIAGKLLSLVPRTRTVLLKRGGIKGQLREPDLELIAGDSNTETTHIENGCIFKLDAMKIMFSKGNINERRRIANLVNVGETVIDMFAGIGYFTVNIAKHAKPRRVISIEINPLAYRYLLENIGLNKLESVVKPINGDCREICAEYPDTADRIIMGLLPSPKAYIHSALTALKRPGIIHYEGITNTKLGYRDLLAEFISHSDLKPEEIKLIGYQHIKSYGPRKSHVRIDVYIRE